jgi:hypothetical protein
LEYIVDYTIFELQGVIERGELGETVTEQTHFFEG